MLVHQKKFYTTKSVLKLEVSQRGIFAEMAEVGTEMKNGMKAFKWSDKLVSKLSNHELIELNYILKVFYGFDLVRRPIEDSNDFMVLMGLPAMKVLLAEKFQGKDYKNYLLIHSDKRSKSNTQIGWSIFPDRIAFTISSLGKKYMLPVSRIVAISLTNYIDFILTKSYEYEMYSTNSDSDYEDEDQDMDYH